MKNRLVILSVIAITLSSPNCLFGASGKKDLSYWWQSAKFKAGFVLPCYKNRYNGNVYYLVGQEKNGRDKGTYSPFGGKAEQGEKHPVVTAAREAYEEMNSAQIINMSQQIMQAYIDTKYQNTKAIIALQKSKAQAVVIYLTDFGHNRMRDQFLPYFCGNSEIGNVAEVAEDRLKKALQNAKQKRPIRVEATVWSSGKCLGNQIITLRPILGKLKKWFQGDLGIIGKDARIHFY